MYAPKEKLSTNGWLARVVVESFANSCPTNRNDRKEFESDIACTSQGTSEKSVKKCLLA
jgi:hypothetical protein